jgi:hypothetical protein
MTMGVMASEIQEIRVEASDLRPGMFVCRLDRPWEGTPFPLQGIELRDERDIRAIRALCRYVYVDARFELRDVRPVLLTRSQLADSRFKRSVV